MAACGGSGEPETRFHATRVIAFGDESSLIVDTRNAIKKPYPHVFKLGAARPAGAGEKVAIA